MENEKKKKKRKFQLTDFLMFILPTIRAFRLLLGNTVVRNETFQVKTHFNHFLLVRVSHSIFFLKFRVIMNQLLVTKNIANDDRLLQILSKKITVFFTIAFIFTGVYSVILCDTVTVFSSSRETSVRQQVSFNTTERAAKEFK